MYAKRKIIVFTCFWQESGLSAIFGLPIPAEPGPSDMMDGRVGPVGG